MKTQTTERKEFLILSPLTGRCLSSKSSVGCNAALPNVRALAGLGSLVSVITSLAVHGEWRSGAEWQLRGHWQGWPGQGTLAPPA